MEVNASSLEKKETNDVVLMMPGVERQSRGSSPKPNTKPVELENPPSSSQISNLTSSSALEFTQSIPTPSKLPNIPTKKSILRPSFAKLKLRFMEPSHPSDTSASASKDDVKPGLSMSPISSVPPPVAEEEDDEDVCETVNPKSQVMLGKTKFILAQYVAFVCITGLLIASLTIRNLRNTVIWHVHLWGWCLLMWEIFCGKLATDRLTTLLVYLIEQKYLLKGKVLYYLFALKHSAKVFAWLCLVFLTWVLLINHGVKRSRYTTKILNWVSRALFSCLIGAALWLSKTFLIKWLTASFQNKKFFDRMAAHIFHHYVIRTLSDPHPAETVNKLGRLRFSLGKYIKGKVRKLEVNIENLSKIKPDKVLAWTMNRLTDIVNFLQLLTLADSLNKIDDNETEQQDKGITDENKAKKAASAIFKNVAKLESKFIEEDDLLRFMTKEHVEKFFAFFPGAKETRKITKSSLKKWLVDIYHEPKSCDFMHERTTVNELNKLASAVSLVVIIIQWLLLTRLLTTQVFVFILSQILLFTFIYGDAAKTWFESIVFVYATRPFDVKDCCVIDGVEVEVEEKNTLTTVFLGHDGKRIFYPNSVLASKAISRSSNMSDSVEFTVDFSTSVEVLEALKNKIRMYIESKPEYWLSDHSVVFEDIADVDNSKVLKMALHVTHTVNFQEAMERTKRRSELVLELKKIFEALHLK